jgi:predicted nucleotidyltransferase
LSTTTISHDFSSKPELRPLAEIVAALQGVARRLQIDFFLVGATARDLLLLYGYGIGGRATQDVDFCVAVDNWNAFNALRTALLASGQFTAPPGTPVHRLYHRDSRPLDIVPFGGVERADRKIAWPPDYDTLFDCFGAREAAASTVQMQLPGEVIVPVASLPALIVLKVMAWRDRKHTHPRKDAPDLLLLVRHYLHCGNFERLAKEHSDLLDDQAFDYDLAGARLAGRDVARLLGGSSVQRVLATLIPEADENSSLLLAQRSGLDFERARQLIAALCTGLGDIR